MCGLGQARGFCPSALVRAHRESSVQLWSPQDRYGPARAGTEEATEVIRGMKHLCYEERLRELGYLKGAYEKAEGRLFNRACCNRIRGNGFKL